MATPSAFKIVSLSTSSAFEPKQKANPPNPCGTMILPRNTSTTETVVYGSNGPYSSTLRPPLNLTGVCKVVLPDYGSATGFPEQYRIQNVTGLAAGQTVLFVNNNTAKYFSFNFQDQYNIEYPPPAAPTTAPARVILNAPAVGFLGPTFKIGVKVTKGGAGYTTAPTVGFNTASVGYTATAEVTDGVVTNIHMTAYGTTPPPTTVTLTPTVGGTGALAVIVSIQSMIINGLSV